MNDLPEEAFLHVGNTPAVIRTDGAWGALFKLVRAQLTAAGETSLAMALDEAHGACLAEHLKAAVAWATIQTHDAGNG